MNFLNTALVKDINTVATTTSDAGFNFYGYNGMAALGKMYYSMLMKEYMVMNYISLTEQQQEQHY